MASSTRPRVGRERTVTLVVVAAGQFLAVMSTSVVSVALPTIGRELDASTTSLEWIVDAYVLVFASLLVAGGVLSDRRGRKPMFVLGVALFGLGSLLAGIAPSVGVLIGGRVVQGLGPAIVLPGSLAIISAIFRDPRERAAAIGLWSASSGLALAVGPASVARSSTGWAGAGCSWSTCRCARCSSSPRCGGSRPSARIPGAGSTCSGPS